MIKTTSQLIYSNSNYKIKILISIHSIILLLFFSACGKSGIQSKYGELQGLDEFNNAPKYAEGEVLVKLKLGISEQELNDFMVRNHIVKMIPLQNESNISSQSQSEITMTQWRRAYLEEDILVMDAMLTLTDDPAIEYFEENGAVYLDSKIPNDPYWTEQISGQALWGLNKIQMPDAWEYSTGSRNVVVAVIDTGLDRWHQDLQGNIWTNNDEIQGNGIDDDNNGYIDDYYGWDWVHKHNNPADDHNHGTHCSGTVGGLGNNGIGVAGVNWQVKIMGLKFLASNNWGWWSDAIAAVKYAADNGAAVSSNSYSGGYSSSFYDVINYARTKGHLLVAAAGNHGNSSKEYPCSFDLDNIICVGATDWNDQKTGFSAYGKDNVDLASPGALIISTLRNNSYGSWAGTSMATPHVAGAAALLKSMKPSISYSEIKSLILSNVDTIPSLEPYFLTGGRLNVKKAISSLNLPPESPKNIVLSTNQNSSISINWDESTDPDGNLSGYRVYYGTSTSNYTKSKDAGNSTNIIIDNLIHQQLYYIAVKAYDSFGDMSEYSEEVTEIAYDNVAPSAIVDLETTKKARSALLINVSSTSGDYSDSFSSSNLTDSNLDTYWTAPLTEYETVQYITFDLGAVSIIDTFQLYPTTGFEEYFPKDFNIQLSSDGENFTTVATETDYVVMPGQWASWMFSPLNARYLRLYITGSRLHENGNYYIMISEAAVYGQTDSLSAALTWTATGDDETQGTAYSYDIRYIKGSSLSEEQWKNLDGSNLISSESPSSAGSLEKLITPGLDGETMYAFAMKVHDEAGNISELSNVATVITPGIPPSAIGNLQVSTHSKTSITLTWIAPGDDGQTGQAAAYDLRYSTEFITPSNFASALNTSLPTPLTSSSAETFQVTGLIENTVYYFAIKSRDETGNWSHISNIANDKTGEPGDLTAPAQIDNLSVRLVTNSNMITITNIESSGSYSEDKSEQNAVDGSEETVWITNDMQDLEEEWLVADLGSNNTIGSISMLCSSLYPYLFPVDFKWEVKTSLGNWDIVAAETNFEAESCEWYKWSFREQETRYVRLTITKASNKLGFHRAVVAEIKIHQAFTVSNSAELSWLAPGDDLFTGTAHEYDIRYSMSPLSDNNFENSERVSDISQPSVPGSFESSVITQLPGENTIYFAIKTGDEATNWSEISNIVSVNTPDISPASPRDFNYLEVNSDNILLTWLSPGDDEMSGTATLYDLRYSTDTISENNFFNAERDQSVSSPSQAYSIHQHRLNNLNPDTQYNIALKAADEKGNYSGMSNMLQVKTLDLIPPAQVENLKLLPPSEDLGVLLPFTISDFSSESENIEESVTAVLDNNLNTFWVSAGNEESCNEYILIDIGELVNIDLIRLHSSQELLEHFPSSFNIQLSQNNENFENVVSESNFETENIWSDWTFNTVSARYLKLQISKCNKSNGLYIASIAEIEVYRSHGETSTLTASFIATGDNENDKKADAYELRYSTEPISNSNFTEAVLSESTKKPKDPGNTEQVLINNLLADTYYYAAIKVIDEAGNKSSISNIAFTETPGIPPGRISNLEVTGRDLTSIDLKWTATGEDLNSGQAEYYEIKKAPFKINHTNWNNATSVLQILIPKESGSQEILTIEGLTSNTAYYFAIRAVDSDSNKGRLSNVIYTTTLPPPESIPPDSIVDLKGETFAEADGSIVLTWTATGDDGNIGKASSYDLRYSESLITADNFYSAMQYTNNNLPPESSGVEERLVLLGLKQETLYYFALKAIDNVGNTSGISNIVFARTKEVPPADITDLTTIAQTETSISIEWTATGENGTNGTADSYEIKYSTLFITEGNWEQVNSVTNPPAPAEYGTKQSLIINGLNKDTEYFFAIRAIDIRNNIGAISNIAVLSTIDAVPPSKILDLNASTHNTDSSILVSWTATGDNGNFGKASSYDLRYSLSPITENNFNQSLQYLNTPKPGNAGLTVSIVIAGLLNEKVYHFAIKVLDENENISLISNQASASTGEVPPSAITNLTASDALFNSITLKWIATGSDKQTGTASSYDIRYSTLSINSNNFKFAIKATNIPNPKVAGTNEQFTINGLTKKTHYYFAITAKDNRGNESAISNITELSTQDPDPPSAINDLKAVATSHDRGISLTWTAPGDDGTVGRAENYDLRYSKQQIYTNNFSSATVYTNISFPLPSGEQQDVTVYNLDPEQRYYFAIKTSDKAENWSFISNSTHAMTNQMAPYQIYDLQAGDAELNSIRLNWTATGDNGNEGTAIEYDIRYSTQKSIVESWINATHVSSVPSPSLAGVRETFNITGLNSNTTYFFGIKAIDDLDNSSPLSNIVQLATIDGDSPGKITDLTVTQNDNQGSVTLNWTASGDDGNIGQAISYDIRYSSYAINEYNFHQAFSISNSPNEPAPAGQNEELIVTNLTVEYMLYFAIIVSDESNNKSLVSNSPGGRTSDMAPSTVQDLIVVSRNLNKLSLSWTATGDNGLSGRASEYDLRCSESAITAQNFYAAVKVTSTGLPSLPGSKESIDVNNLKTNTKYYFALKVIDDRGNLSEISNTVVGYTIDNINPGAITSLRAIPPLKAGTNINISISESSGEYASEFNAEKVVDNDTSTEWITPKRENSTTEYIIFDAGQEHLFSKVKIFPSRDFAPMFPKDFDIQISNNLSDWVTVLYRENYIAESGIWQSFSFTPQKARYIRLLITQAADLEDPYVIISEFKVFAAPNRNDVMNLRWIASGDDNNTGSATSYDLRYSISEINENNFVLADQAENEPSPSISGTLESLSINDLEPETLYYFALKSMDEDGNSSVLSNVESAMTLSVPPAKIKDLRALALTSSTLRLIWTAPGDDYNSGTATAYDLRYNIESITESNWNKSTQITQEPVPNSAGEEESFTVTGLASDTIYYFAIKTKDDTDQESILSNLCYKRTLSGEDRSPPEAINSLSATSSSKSGSEIDAEVIFSSGSQFPYYTMDNLTDGDLASDWSTPLRESNQEEEVILDLMALYSTSSVSIMPSEAFPGLFPVDFSILSSLDSISWSNLASVNNFEAETGNWYTWDFSVTTARYIKIHSTKSNSLDGINYFTIMSEIKVEEASLEEGSVLLSWIAPGDDGSVGKADNYNIRYSESIITELNFNQATQVNNTPDPVLAGGIQSTIINGLNPGTIYYFAVKTKDEAANLSEISNVVQIKAGGM